MVAFESFILAGLPHPLRAPVTVVVVVVMETGPRSDACVESARRIGSVLFKRPSSIGEPYLCSLLVSIT
jgi:hypothetical protein